MKILITGGLGLIGSHLTKQLLAENHEVIIYDARRNFAKTGNYAAALELRKPLLEGAKMLSGDIQDGLLFHEVMEVFQPEVVVHLAAIPVFNPRGAYLDEMLDINFYGSQIVFEAAARAASVRRIIYASSSMAYGTFTQNPQGEEAILAPLDRYGVSKASSELLLRQICTEAEKEWVIIRPTSVYGPTDCNNRVIQRFVETGIQSHRSQITNASYSIFATEGEKLDFTYVEDAAQGFRLAIHTKQTNEIYNISAGKAEAIYTAASLVLERFPTLIVATQKKPVDGYRPTRGTMDIRKAREKLGFAPMFTLESGIDAYIDYCLANQ